MHPILFEIHDWPVHAFGVLLAVACLVALTVAVVRARRAGLDDGRVLDLGIYLIIAGLLGARLTLALLDVSGFAAVRELSSLIRAGGVFYGGLIAGTAAALWLVPRFALPFWTTADLFAPGIALGQAIGRVGCLLAGCCHGRPSSVPWAITFTNPAAASAGTPLGIGVHPTQIYEAAAALLIVVLLVAVERRDHRFPGRSFLLYVLLFAASRFVIEFYRGDARDAIGGLSVAQMASLIALPCGVVGLARLRRSPLAGSVASTR